jgi:hypothetical protein
MPPIENPLETTKDHRDHSPKYDQFKIRHEEGKQPFDDPFKDWAEEENGLLSREIRQNISKISKEMQA